VSTAGGQDQEGTDTTVPSWVTLPDDLTAAASDAAPATAEQLRAAADRIVELEEEVLALRKEADRYKWAIVGHRGAKDFNGNKDDTDRRLWTHVADVPWGKPIKGDG
jgi:hypothetical protein